MSTLLGDLTWPEVSAAKSLAPLVIMPVGSCEQHGPAMALRTDSARAEAVAVRLADALAPQALVTPCLAFGVSEHHMAFPGTITLDPVTFQQVVYEVVRSLYRHGWRKVFVLNGHGGNTSALGVLLDRCLADLPDLQIAAAGISSLVKDLSKRLAVSEIFGHSCEIETSQTLYLAPDLVRDELRIAGSGSRADLGPVGRLARPGMEIASHQSFAVMTELGNLGDARAATADIGEALITAYVDRVVPFLRALIAAPPTTWEGRS